MSKFYFSNVPVLDRIHSNKEKCVELLSGEISSPKYDFAVYYKSRVYDLNFIELGNNDFIAITGTLLYKNFRGKDLLLEVYKDYLELGDSVRCRFLGNYAIVIKHNDIIVVFGEETYFYDIFYYNKDGVIVVANELYDIYRYVAGLEVDQHNLFEQAYIDGVIGNETVLKDVYRLSGDQKIVIDLTEGSLRVETMPVDWSRVMVSFDEAVDKLASNLKKEAESLKSTYQSTAICMTGGLDSRLSFAALVAGDNRPSLYYGVGNSSLTNTHNEDLKICKLFSNAFALPLTKMDWSTPTPIDLNWDCYLNKYGLLYHAYASSGHVMSSLEDIKEEYVTLGLVGELFRTLDFTETRKHFTIEEYVDEYYLPKNDAGTYIEKHCDDFPAFRKRLIEKYTSVCRRFGLDPNNMVVEDFFYLNLEYRANADNVMLNLINRMRYCSWLLGNYSVIKQANINVEHLKNSHFMICALEKLCPECLEIPVFSHQHKKVYDKRKKKLKEPFKTQLRHLFSAIIPQYIKKYLISKIYTIQTEEGLFLSEECRGKCSEILSTENKCIKISRFDIVLIQYLVAFNKVSLRVD